MDKSNFQQIIKVNASNLTSVKLLLMSDSLLLGLESFATILQLALMRMTCQVSLLLDLPFLRMGSLHVPVKLHSRIEAAP